MTDFLRRAVEQSAAGEEPTMPIDAATVVVIRDGGAGVEVLLVRRNSKLAFAGGMWVFPGGRVDDEDVAAPIGSDEFGAHRAAAVREAMEEAGIVVDGASAAVLSHWLPPAGPKRRFSTWFFVATHVAAADIPGPGMNEVVVDGGEIHDHVWIDPAEALDRRDRNEVELLPPTWVTLHTLASLIRPAGAPMRSAEEVVIEVAGEEPFRYETRVGQEDGAIIVMWDGDAGYESGDVTAPGARHRLAMRDPSWVFERSD